MDDWMTAREAAEYARCHWRTLTDACRAGELPGVQRARNCTWRVRRADVDAWLGVRPLRAL
jgi:excisionase family DNA binding protein